MRPGRVSVHYFINNTYHKELKQIRVSNSLKYHSNNRFTKQIMRHQAHIEFKETLKLSYGNNQILFYLPQEKSNANKSSTIDQFGHVNVCE